MEQFSRTVRSHLASFNMAPVLGVLRGRLGEQWRCFQLKRDTGLTGPAATALPWLALERGPALRT